MNTDLHMYIATYAHTLVHMWWSSARPWPKPTETWHAPGRVCGRTWTTSDTPSVEHIGQAHVKIPGPTSTNFGPNVTNTGPVGDFGQLGTEVGKTTQMRCTWKRSGRCCFHRFQHYMFYPFQVSPSAKLRSWKRKTKKQRQLQTISRGPGNVKNTLAGNGAQKRWPRTWTSKRNVSWNRKQNVGCPTWTSLGHMT